MRVMMAHRPGPPEVLRPEECPDPEPGPGQVLVAVQFASVAFVDTLVRGGRSPGPQASFPLVPGNGVGGTVVEVGPGVDTGWEGVNVTATTGGRGGYATLALADTDQLHRIPAELDLSVATALLADGRTAVGLATAAGIRPGDVVAVTAAAGGVGSLLVQLAARAGARVVALAGSDPKLAQARRLGARSAVNYRRPGWEQAMSQLDALDVAFDGVGGEVGASLLARLRGGGRFVAHGMASGSWTTIDPAATAARDITVVPLAALGSPADLFELVEEAYRLAATGVIRPLIGQMLPLDQAAEAHAAIEARSTVGKTLLAVGDAREVLPRAR